MKSLFSPLVLRNFSALFVLQTSTYLIPLILVPYLIRTVGLELFGTLMFAMAFVIVARICVSYGFDLTATRQVAAGDRHSPDRLSELLVDVTAARLVIWAACFAVLTGLSFFVGQLADIRLLLVVALFILLGEVLFPVWLFQGMERMGTIMFLRLGSKLVTLVLTFALVKGPEDLLLVPALEASTSLAAGLIAFAVARRRFSLLLVRPHLARIRQQFRDGAHIFISTFAVQFYTTVNMIALGLLVGPAAVGAYSLAEKIYSALRGLLGPFIQAIFPVMARMHGTSQFEFNQYYRNVLIYLLPVLGGVGIALFAAAGPLVKLASGSEGDQAVRALQVFAIAFPFAVGSFLSPMLVVRGRSEFLMRITLIGGAIGLVLSPLLSIAYGAVGAVTVFLVVQVYNSIALAFANNSAR
jgi:PST family polysaccharide transporter